MNRLLFTMLTTLLMSGYAMAQSHASVNELSNDEYDRQLMANRSFDMVDSDKDGVITSNEIEQITWMRYKNIANMMSAKFGGKDMLRDEFVAEYTLPENISDGEMIRNVLYKRVGDVRLMLDIYMPPKKGDRKIPVMLFFHGGGWKNGDKYIALEDKFMMLMRKLHAQGVAVVAVNYRLYNYEDQFVRDCSIDAKDALAFVNRHADEYGFDNKNIAVMGESAGGHISSMVGLTGVNDLPGDKELAPYRIQPKCFVVWYGPCTVNLPRFLSSDDLSETQKNSLKRFTTSTHPAVVQAVASELSSVEYVDSNDPMALIMCGDRDEPAKAYLLNETMNHAGVENEVFIVKNGNHGWWSNDSEPDLEGICTYTANYVIDKLK